MQVSLRHRHGRNVLRLGLVVACFVAASAAAQAREGRDRPPPQVRSASAEAAAPAQRSLTALQYAALAGMSYQDSRTFVLFERNRLRVRLYPTTFKAVVAGHEYTLKDRIVRSGTDVVLSPRIVEFMNRKIQAFRTEESARVAHAARVRPRARPRPLPPLPPVTPVLPVREHAPIRELATAPKPQMTSSVRSGEWAPHVEERKWKWIILHHSDDLSGCVAKYDRYHRDEKHWEHGCGYHFVIGNGSETADGEVEMGPRWKQQLHGAHAKTPDNRYNDFGVGICLVGDFENGDSEPSRPQMDGLVRLVRWLMERYDIPPENVMGHRDCCNTRCPGKNFPWAAFRARIR